MREIKFRAWLIPNRKYIEEWEVNFYNGELSHYKHGWWGDYILEQYTGLKDKNGVEIYEGDVIGTFTITGELMYKDIVKWSNGYNIGVNGYEYNYEIYGFIVENEYLYSCLIGGDVEVIGNIHEESD